MRHLVWKDAMAVRSLLLAIVAGIFGAFVFLLAVSPLMSEKNVSDMFVSFWILMPNLFALGVPAILIGNEQERGSLSWLRTLPVQWQSIADSKMLVALAGLSICWLVSSLLLISGSVLVSGTLTPYATEMFSLAGVAHLANFSLMLMLLGLATAYLFRSPVAGLIAVVPLIGGVTFLSDLLGRLIVTGQIRDYGAVPTPSQRDYFGLVAAALIGLLCVGCLQRMLAKRRLGRTSSTLSILPSTNRKLGSLYRPPIAISPRRPSVVAALMWQQRRQCLYLGILILGMGVIAVLFALLELSTSYGNGFWMGIMPLLLAMAALWLGSLVFYGDNFRKHRHYFAERGVRANVIWWTRLSIPALLCVSLIVLMLAGYFFASSYGIGLDLGSPMNEPAMMTNLMMLCFAFSQLVSQWMRRPVLAFFAAPALMLVPCFALMFCVMLYPGYVWWSMSSVLVLLFATWQLAGPWIENHGSYGSCRHGISRFIELLKKPEVQAAGYVSLALAIPAIAIVTLRVASTPPLRSQWRETLLANPVSEPRTYFNGRPIVTSLRLETFGYSNFSEHFTDLLNENRRNECLRLLYDELAATEIGENLSPGDIEWVLQHAGDQDVEMKLTAIEIWLSWASRIRRGVCEGDYSFRDLLIAEEIESRAVENLLAMLQTNHAGREASEEDSREMASAINKLFEKIPSADLRSESRRVALLADWQIYNRQKWVWDNGDGLQYEAKNFMGYPIASRYTAIPYERLRADRIVDELTFSLLRDLEGESVALEGDSAKHSLRLWRELISPVNFPTYHLPTWPYWTQATDEKLERLRSKVANLVSSDEDNLSERKDSR